jgi:hypothetical protein
LEDLSIDLEHYPGQLGTHAQEFWTTTLKAISDGSRQPQL